MSAPKDELLRAIELALAGQWDAAHEIVQQYEGDATASWIHAVLHKIEGDEAARKKTLDTAAERIFDFGRGATSEHIRTDL